MLWITGSIPPVPPEQRLELGALAGLDPSLEEGTDGIDGEEHHDGEDGTEEEG